MNSENHARKQYEAFLYDAKKSDRRLRFGGDSTRILRFMEKYASRFEAGEAFRIADVGCGTGLHSIEIAKRFESTLVRGFEPSQDLFPFAVENARHAKVKNLCLERKTSEDAADAYPGHFDIVLSHLVACFADSFEGYARSLARMLRAGGTAIVCDFFFPELETHRERSAMDRYFRSGYKFVNQPLRALQWLELFERSELRPVNYVHVPIIRQPATPGPVANKFRFDRSALQKEIERSAFLPPGFFEGQRLVKYFVFEKNVGTYQ